MSVSDPLPGSREPLRGHSPLLLAGLLLSILPLLRLAATDAAALPLLLLLQGQVLVGIVVDELVHVASFLTLNQRSQSINHAAFNGAKDWPQCGGAHPAPAAALLLLLGHLLRSLVKGEQVLGLLHVQRSLLQELLLFLLLFVPLFFLAGVTATGQASWRVLKSKVLRGVWRR